MYVNYLLYNEIHIDYNQFSLLHSWRSNTVTEDWGALYRYIHRYPHSREILYLRESITIESYYSAILNTFIL